VRESWPIGCGQLAAVMRWRAPIERPAKGDAVIGRRGDRQEQALTVGEQESDSPRLPSAPREVKRDRRTLHCFLSPTQPHDDVGFFLLLPPRWRSPPPLSPPPLSPIQPPPVIRQQPQMAAQMVITGLSISLG